VFLERLGKSAVSIWDHKLDNAEDGFRRREGFLWTKGLLVSNKKVSLSDTNYLVQRINGWIIK
jgi:hypothetical protein